ncbi:periplasmic binding protein [Methanolacinia petrolearia DSM 11571]|uniref:Periplasmic binding protein n=1 Tax=Methanolacinia petrolearia (strain DSM 11571 / OCM 486 / SEBR 4847) TaxID=679926 RepID=E1RI15_METP4|nr:ABC transporter substrate-binding protein [Methanolacinia petrolearia]ADN35400.1 periplasmic binding protein [Methanolacinia petrolearia DSM 11571]
MKSTYKKAEFFLILMLSAAFLFTVPVYAATQENSESLPLDNNSDLEIKADELAPEILSYLTEKYINGNDSAVYDKDLADAAYIYSNWNGKPKTVTDTKGQEITLYRPLRNIAVMNSETLETMRSLGLDEDIVSGVGKYTLADEVFFPEYSDKENTGSVWSPDYEKIISLSPDAVFLYADFMEETADEIQEKIQSMDPSIKVFRFDMYYPSTYINETKLLGEVIDKEDEAEKLTGFYNEQMNAIDSAYENIPKDERTQVYFESWVDYKSAANGSGYNEKINLAGGVSIFEDATPEYPIVSPEEILVKNPDVIVKLIGSGELTFGGYEDNNTEKAQEVYETITSRAGWQNLDAVKDDHVYILSNDIFGGPEYIIGTLYLAKWMYPDELENVDPTAVHQKYISEFQHLDFDVDNNGVFVWSGNQ